MRLALLVLGLIFNRWVLLAVVLVALALVIWLVGPAISVFNVYPFEEVWVRWLQIALLVMIPAVKWVWGTMKARRASTALTQGLLQPVPARPEAGPDPSAEDVAQVRERFEQALAMLRKWRFGPGRPSLWARARALGSQRHLYDLPWYVFIGAPGSGKTTALVNSGLRFPLADRLGREAVRGVGGTRDCDWWFTDEAVFLDTAGRYTTHESNREVDAGAWQGFLQILKKARPRRPINGLLVTVSVGDLLRESPSERESQAQALRARVQELYERLGARFPIYVLVTKSDLLAGFTEFFGALGREERAQVWGFSLPLGQERLDPAAMSAELERLERRLYERLPERLEEERDPARRALVYGFPEQFARLRDRLVAFVEDTFAPTKFEVAPLLRGVYFTSGTQDGSPIDRVMGVLAREMGLGRRLLPPQQATGRSYFLTRLLREVVFPESGLAGLDLRGERRRQWLQRGAIAGAAAVLVLTSAAWWISYRNNRVYIEVAAAQFAEVKKQVAAIRAGAKNDLSALVPLLTSVDELSRAGDTPDGSVPWSSRLGLSQRARLDAASERAYQRMLQDTLLPSLAAYLERDLGQKSAASPEAAYGALKAYLMLYDRKHFRGDDVWRWYQANAGDLLPGADAGAQKALKAHFDNLYRGGWVEPAIPRNDAVVARVRGVIGRDSLTARIYERLKREPLADVRDFTIVDQAGPKAMLAFQRKSRESLTQGGVPALYTKDGYYKHAAPRIERLSAELADEESWVLGADRAAGAGVPKPAETVKRAYLEDYRRTWRRFIDDISVLRGRDLTGTREITQVISAPDTPLKPLMKAIDRETRLSVPPEGVAAKAQEYKDKARQMLGAGPAGSLEKALVDDHFEDVTRFVASPGGNVAPPIDTLVSALSDLYQWVIAAMAALEAGSRAPPPDAVNKLRAEMGRQPVARAMVEGLVEDGARQVFQIERGKQEAQKREEREKQEADKREAQARQDAEKRATQEQQETARREARKQQMEDLRQKREQAEAELRTQVADFCVKATSGRYPFVKTSDKDVTPQDFTKLFAPGGMLEGFFQKHLAAQVDTSQRPWRFKDSTWGPGPSLPEFQRAQVIREVFFGGGPGAPSIQFEFKPVEMDASILQIVLDVDGKLVRYAHGPPVPVKVQFPGPADRRQVRVSISPPPSSGSTGLRFDGPWALFRMFDTVQLQETRQAERFVATIAVEGRRAVFEVSASSVRNPFRLTELSQFRCPTQL
jgi:type VI secretion system protein ImpL